MARPIYRTNLFPRNLNIGGQCIKLRTAGPRSLAAKADDPAELVIDALRALGKAHITDVVIAKLQKFVNENALKKMLRKRSRRALSWMLPIIDKILNETDREFD